MTRPSLVQMPTGNPKPPPKPEPPKEARKKSTKELKPKRISKSVAALLNDTGDNVETRKALVAANNAKNDYNKKFKQRMNSKSIFYQLFRF